MAARMCSTVSITTNPNGIFATYFVFLFIIYRHSSERVSDLWLLVIFDETVETQDTAADTTICTHNENDDRHDSDNHAAAANERNISGIILLLLFLLSLCWQFEWLRECVVCVAWQSIWIARWAPSDIVYFVLSLLHDTISIHMVKATHEKTNKRITIYCCRLRFTAHYTSYLIAIEIQTESVCTSLARRNCNEVANPSYMGTVRRFGKR